MKTYKSGISLIVLVITVIVLSILAATVIVDLDNTDIIDKASETVFKSDMSNYKELFQTYIANKRVENPKFDRDSLNVTSSDAEYTEIFGDNVKDEYKEKLQVKNGKLVYNTEDAEEAELVKDVGILVITPITITPISELAIGDLVEYTPTASATGTYSGATYVENGTNDYGYTTYIESTTNYTPGTLKWVYLGQDENGNTLLTSQEATSFTVTIGGQDGWVTGPDRLDALCNTLYGNSTYALTTRNMKIEDVDRILGYNDHDGVVEDGEGPLGMYYDSSGWVTTDEAMTFGAIETAAGTSVCVGYKPRLSTTTIENYLSDIYEYTGTTYEPDTTTAEYKVIFRKANGTTNQSIYWLSSPAAFVRVNAQLAHFCVRFVNDGKVSYYDSVYVWNGNEYDNSFALRPVVVLKSNIQFGEKNADGEWTLVEM